MRIEKEPWEAVLAHALATYPEECCGALLGRMEAGAKRVTRALALENVSPAPRRFHYEVRQEDLLAAARQAHQQGLRLVGIYHSHPDRDAYFSETDLKNSTPWYSFLVVSVRSGAFDHARCWLPNREQTGAEPEELIPET
jgi:proteasome lid subunit RPN8/RPN11